jgi:chromosome condensin MukBEF ATPase and DNA-binding subunit MukB
MAQLDVAQIAETQQRKIDQTNSEIEAAQRRLEEEEAVLAKLNDLKSQSSYSVEEINYLLQFL